MDASGAAEALLERVRHGDTLALARAITAVENRTLTGLQLGLAARTAGAACASVGVTGAPGAGKSSLVAVLIGELLPRFPRIGVLTVDPSSPISGGAVLGDRVRMAAYSANPGVFIRSLAARGHLGGVTRTTRSVIDLLGVAGMDLVIVETVGTGQSEVEVAELTDVKLVICAPGLGDEMQAIKAGVLEIADLLVVNKSDLPDAARTAAHLNAMLRQRGCAEQRTLHQVSTVTQDGVAALAAAIETRLNRRSPADRTAATTDTRARLADDVAAAVAAFVRGNDAPQLRATIERLSTGAITRQEAVSAALRVLANERVISSGKEDVS